jgi:5'-nucleotidase
VPQYRHLTKQTKFPWLLANVLDPALGENVPLGNAGRTVMLTSSNGIKIGVIGLAEREWLATVNSLPPDIIYKSASETAKELIPGLKKQGAEIIIAIAHQREPNDNKLAEKTDGMIDIILGGHDHYYAHSFINGTHVLRSGSDFKQLSYIEARRRPSDKSKWDFNIYRRDVVSEIERDPPTVELVEKLTSSLKSKLEKPIGYTAAPLDARFRTVRLQESNIGNFVCDLMRFYYQADCCIMAAGTIRGDQIYPPGVLKLKDLMNCFPFEDPVVVLKVKGQAIVDALENSVSKFPALEGRFPQVSNIEFEFHPEKPEGQRVMYTKIGDEDVDLEKDYKLATRGYMARGKGNRPVILIFLHMIDSADNPRIDGYTSLLIQEEGGVAEEIVSEENGVLISTLLRQYFLSMKVMGKWRHWGPSMGRVFSTVQQNLSDKHNFFEPGSKGAKDNAVEALRKSSAHTDGTRTPPSAARAHRERQYAEGDVDLDSSDDSDDESDRPVDASRQKGPVSQALSEREKELSIMRKVMRKWRRIAGLPENAALADQLGEGEFSVNWTKVCPFHFLLISSGPWRERGSRILYERRATDDSFPGNRSAVGGAYQTSRNGVMWRKMALGLEKSNSEVRHPVSRLMHVKSAQAQ